MSTTLKDLPCVRFVKRVSNGALGSKYSYIAMMADNAKALETAQWRKASTPLNEVSMPVNKVTETDAVYDESGAMVSPPSFKAFTDDRFDAFQQGGDARKENATMCGYAGCVAYRFKIPDTAIAGTVPLSSVALAIQRDRYCRAGVRVALELSNSTLPSDDWAVVRGAGSGAIVSPSTSSDAPGVASWGFLGQADTGNLVSGRAADGVITFNAGGTGGFPALATTGKSYLWVYISLEDYNSYWTMYNATDPRYYSIEGSAMLVASKASFTFNGGVTPDDPSTGNFIDGAVGGFGGIHNYEESGAGAPTAESVFGESFCCASESGVFLTSHTLDVRNAMLNLDLLSTKDAITGAPRSCVTINGTAATITAPFIQADCCDVIGAKRSVPSFGSVFLWITSKNSTADNTHGALCALSAMGMRYCAYVTPPDKEEYTKIQYANSYIFKHYFGGANEDPDSKVIDCDLLLWRSKSKAFFGPWREVAMTALAKNTAFFTGTSESISGAVDGTGEVTTGISVRAEAQFLARITPTGANTKGTIDLVNPLRSSEVVIAVPILRNIKLTAEGAEDKFTFFSNDGEYARWETSPSLAFK